MTSQKKTFLENSWVHFLFIPLIPAIYLMAQMLGRNTDHMTVQPIMALAVLLLTVVALWAVLKKKMTWAFALSLVLLTGFILRIGYMLYTDCWVRSHDLGDFSVSGQGHAAYILTILETGRLPADNSGQFYQQPLYYLLGAGISKVSNGILGTDGAIALVDGAKIVSCMASCSVLLMAVALCRELGAGDKGCTIGGALVAFLPDFCFCGGRVNSDMLACFFMTLAVLYTVRFYKNQSWKNILVLAFAYGFGMMTKISCASVALFTAAVFLVLLIQKIRQGQWKELLAKFAVFGLISLPLGLWFSVRNFILFGQPITYVAKISVESELYTGGHSVFSRFVPLDWKNLFATPYADPWNDYNLPLYQLKSSLFGEFTYSVNDFIPVVLLFTALTLAALTLWATASQIRKNWNHADMLQTFAVILIMLGSSIMFYVNYPFGCSMDFRYYILLPVLFAPFLARTAQESGKLGKMLQINISAFAVMATSFLLLID